MKNKLNLIGSKLTGLWSHVLGEIKRFQLAQKSQVFAHLTYVFAGCFLLAWPKTLIEFFTLAAFNHTLDHILRRFVFPDARPGAKSQILSPSIIIISGGVFLLLQGYSIWGYLLAGAIGVSSRYIFTINKHPVFNPANIGVLSVTLVFPALGSSFSDQWVGRGDLIAYMVIIGTLTAFFAQ